MATASSQTAGPVRATITLDFEEFTKLREENERLRITPNRCACKFSDAPTAGETQWLSMCAFHKVQTDKITDQLRADKVELVTHLGKLEGYATTVRTDRRDSTGEFALQTVDWCEGLLEYAGKASEILAKHATQEGGAR